MGCHLIQHTKVPLYSIAYARLVGVYGLLHGGNGLSSSQYMSLLASYSGKNNRIFTITIGRNNLTRPRVCWVQRRSPEKVSLPTASCSGHVPSEYVHRCVCILFLNHWSIITPWMSRKLVLDGCQDPANKWPDRSRPSRKARQNSPLIASIVSDKLIPDFPHKSQNQLDDYGAPESGVTHIDES